VLFRQRSRLRPLSERECYLRLHGTRSGEIEVVERSSEGAAARMPPPFAEEPAPTGPTEPGPALHLAFSYPRGAGTLTGEQLRVELLRRMQNRAGEAA
jgi:hypothetical protein